MHDKDKDDYVPSPFNTLEEMLLGLSQLQTPIRLVTGEREEDPGMRYFFYLDRDTGRPVSPFFHSKPNAEVWFLKHFG